MNSQRGMSTFGAVLLAATAGLLTATLMMDWMVVDVHVVEQETPVHVKVPFPVEARAQKELVLATLEALLDSPDAEFVKVQTEDANVEIFKEGSTLRIAVDADDAVVRCNVPIDGVLEALESWDWETFDPQMVFDVLHAAENGDLVTVATDDGVRVAIKMW